MKSPLLPFALIGWLVLFCRAETGGQENSTFNAERFIEWLSEEMEEESDISHWLEELVLLSENPLDINSASVEELLRIPFLDEVTAGNIVEYRQKAGLFQTMSELTSVKGIGRELAGKIAAFTIIAFPGNRDYLKTGGRDYARQQVLLKGWQSFPKPAGYYPKGDKPPAFQGGPQKLYARYLFQKGKSLQAGITGENDPGEPFFRGTNPYGFDFYSFHLAFRINDRVPGIIAGDYSVRTGQGLVLSQGFSMGKSAEVIQSSRPAGQVRPYTSTGENFFFRGAAASFRFGNIRSHLFLSGKKSDGNLKTDETGRITFSSLQNSGYHRTLSEIEDKNSVRHLVSGFIAGITSGNLFAGINILYEQFQYPFIRGDQLYQRFMFRGRENLNFSFDYRYIPGKYQFFGEMAISRSGGVAMIHGMQGRLHDQLNISMVFRHYGVSYHSTWGNAFGEGSTIANETGFYFGLKAFPFPKITLSGYADWFRFPWITYSTAGPSSGYDYFVQGDWRYSRKLNVYVRWKTKFKATKVKNSNFYEDLGQRKDGYRLNLRYQLSDRLFVRSRIEHSRFELTGVETGFMVFQDVGWTPSRYPLSVTTRLMWFSTEGYHSRIYAYENDLLYNFSTISVFGDGFRVYINTKAKLSDGLECWLKAGSTLYSGQETISSGHGKIDGNRKSEVKIQLRYRF
ncbi:MAG: ComEA family DNA-binding protein [Bacteroidota bacterium]